jgi:hypothetical protein
VNYVTPECRDVCATGMCDNVSPWQGLTALTELGLLGGGVVFGLSHGGAGSDPDGLQDAKVQAEWMIQQREKKKGGGQAKWSRSRKGRAISIRRQRAQWRPRRKERKMEKRARSVCICSR